MELIAAIAGFIIGFFVAICCFSEDVSKLKSKAIENHCASYIVTDSLQGTLQFKWNNEKEISK